MNHVIWWIRRDLRLSDNPCIQTAIERNEIIIPVFIQDPHFNSSKSSARFEWMMSCLTSLNADLIKKNSRLILREGKPIEVLQQLFRETKATRIYAMEDYSPYAMRRDQEIQKHLPLHLLAGVTIHPPDSIKKPDGKPYTIFTPYSNSWKSLPLPSAPLEFPEPLRPFSLDLNSLPISQEIKQHEFFPSEQAALTSLQKFCSADIYEYDTFRDRIDLDRTSHLSPYLRFGVISPKQAYQYAMIAIRNSQDSSQNHSCDHWINELIWREFYFSILFHYPEVLKTSFNPIYRQIQWQKSAKLLHSWQNGQTGYPIVDAGMRYLHENGWLHNRLRMIVASFLVKDLLINWQEGEKWFMQHLIDGEPASNNGGWQWTAGTGTDAVPYFRIFNPILQSQKCDPHGDFIRRWIPELNKVSNQYIHYPWKIPLDEQIKYGCRIGRDYPKPIVDHSQARELALKKYKEARYRN
jgi:deoxyribodipyrimidine photo-lyase